MNTDSLPLTLVIRRYNCVADGDSVPLGRERHEQLKQCSSSVRGVTGKVVKVCRVVKTRSIIPVA
jgi:hypothetical protein